MGIIQKSYVRQNANEWDLDIPSDIALTIFMFYYIKMFDIEYGKKINRKDNTITNIDDSVWNPFGNTSVIGDWMDPDVDNNYIHTIKIKIIKKTDEIGIGIVKQEYDMEEVILFNEGYAFFDNGTYYKTGLIEGAVDGYSTGQIVLLKLNLKELSLSYEIIDDINGTESKKGILYESGTIDKTKYKWAVSVCKPHDCVEIIDVHSKN